MADQTDFIQEIPGGIRIHIHTQPGAKRTEIVGRHGEALKIRVQAPPVDGRANEELIRFLAKTLGLSQNQIEISRGQASRAKSFNIQGISLEQARRVLNP